MRVNFKYFCIYIFAGGLMKKNEARIIVFCQKPRRSAEISARFDYSISWTYGMLSTMVLKGYLIRRKLPSGAVYYVANKEYIEEAMMTLDGNQGGEKKEEGN